MNDCFWCFICRLSCASKGCYKCSKYISVNSDEGAKLLQQYGQEVEEALQPVREKWEEKMNGYSAH